MERNFKGIWIPAEIWLCKDLTMQEKIFLVEIDSLDNENGCYANNQYFSEFFGISKTRVSLVIQGLMNKGYIKTNLIYKKDSKQILNRIININRPPYPTKVIEGIQQKLYTPTQQKLKDNNIYNNNIYNNICPSENEKKLEDFEKIWELYPRKEAKASAFKSYLTLLNGKAVLGKKIKLTNKDIWIATDKYANSVTGYDTKFIKLGSTFFNSGIFDYLEEND
jgi:hypothetical protein